MKPDHLEGFGPSNRIPGSTREEKTYISPRTPIKSHAISRKEVTVSGGKGVWRVYERTRGHMIATIVRYHGEYTFRIRSGTPSKGFRTRNAAVRALLEAI